MATLPLTRGFSLLGSAASLQIFVNGASIGTIANKQTADFAIPGGKLNVQMRWGDYGQDSEIVTVTGVRSIDVIRMSCIVEFPMHIALKLDRQK